MKKLIGLQDPLYQWALHPNHLYEYGLELNVSPNQLLENTGLTQADLQNIDLKISWLQYKELASNVGHYGSHDWGFQLGKRLHVASHGLLSLLVMNCANWMDVIDIMEHYPILVSPIFYVTKKQSTEHITLSVHPESTRHPILERSLETFFTSLYQVILELGSGALHNSPNDIYVMLKGPAPAYQASMREFFQHNIGWNHYANQIRINKTLLSRSIPHASPITADSMRRMMQAQLNQLPALTGGLHELRTLFAQGLYKQEQCAQQMLTTLSTFKRYLHSACTSFSQELTLYRLEEACWAAIHTDISQEQLSEQLGFQDVNSFGRLFKKSFGQAFNHYRSEQRQTSSPVRPV